MKISSESHWIMSSSIHADELPLKMSPEDFIPKLAEVSRKMRGIPIMRDTPIDLIKKWKAGLKNLLVNTCITRRIRGRAIRDYQVGECQNSPYPFNDCTYYSAGKGCLGDCSLPVEMMDPEFNK